MPAAPSGRERLAALDGLRGVAAVVVLISHCMLLIPAVADAFRGDDGETRAVWLVTYTPLHAAWAGAQAVFVFFVLSGFVLTRAADSSRFTWRSYYPSRLLRLYLPVAAALVFAAVVYAIVPKTGAPEISWWLRAQQTVTVTAGSFVRDLMLVRGADLLLPPLWSLKWEVLFSLLLPLAVYGASRRPRIALLEVAVLLAIMVFGADTPGRQGYLLYLPMFGIGAIMARHQTSLARFGRSLGAGAGAVVTVVAVVLLTISWVAHNPFNGRFYRPVEVIGAALLVFLFGYWSPLRAWAETRPLQWLGKRSFSLYLVHYPIVLGTAMILGAQARYAFAIAIPLALIASDLFFRLAEGPSHRLSQAVRAKIRR